MARVSEIALLRELVEISELERFKSLDRIAGGIDSVACGAEMRHSGRVDGGLGPAPADDIPQRKMILLGS